MQEGIIRPIKRKENISNLVAKQLIELILSGKFAPGERLPTEKELSDMFGVGRNTLREAIRTLSTLGFVEVSVPEGMFIAQSFDNFYTRKLQMTSRYGYDNVQELIEARASVEYGIVRLAAQKATEVDKENLRVVFEKLRIAQDDNSRREGDVRFHFTIADIADNGFLKQTLLLLIDGIHEWIRKLQMDAPAAHQISTLQHQAIMEAVCAGDPELAGQKMKEHMDYVGGLYIDIEHKARQS